MPSIGIKELAKHLQISTASVSRALNKPQRVSKKMRERVQSAAKEMGYRPNKIGSSLRTSKSGNIVVIIPDLSDTFNSGLIHSIETCAEQHGYSVLFGDSQSMRDRELRYGDLVQHKQADGIIFFCPTPPFDEDLLNSSEFDLPPMVNSCEIEDMEGYLAQDKRIPFVTIDNVAASEELVNHLIDIGHQRIAVITGDMQTPSAKQRLQGFKNAHRNAGITLDEKFIFEGRYTLEEGERLAIEILKLKNRPSAIFCMCDESAIGCLYSLNAQGLKIPDDIAVCGFDNIRFSKYSNPALTTVDQSVAEIGKQCVELLIQQINGEVSQRHKIIPHKIIIRNSTVAN